MAEKTAPVAQRGRVKRTPINGRNILNVTGKEPGYEYRFVNDVGDRVAIFQERGWEIVDSADVKVGDRRIESPGPLGSKAQIAVDKQGSKAFLMRIKKEWYDEDQSEKARSIAEQELAMKQQALSSNDLRTGKLEVSR